MGIRGGGTRTGRQHARRLKVLARTAKTGAAIKEIVDGPSPERIGPFPLQSIHRLMGDAAVQEAIRGDGSRRRCAEVREGLRKYRSWLAEDDFLWRFATYLFSASDGYPEFDIADFPVEALAYVPPRTTVNYDEPVTERTPKDYRVVNLAAWHGAMDVKPVDRDEWWSAASSKRRLGDDDKAQIRRRYLTGLVSQKILAKDYGVSQGTIERVLRER